MLSSLVVDSLSEANPGSSTGGSEAANGPLRGRGVVGMFIRKLGGMLKLILLLYPVIDMVYAPFRLFEVVFGVIMSTSCCPFNWEGVEEFNGRYELERNSDGKLYRARLSSERCARLFRRTPWRGACIRGLSRVRGAFRGGEVEDWGGVGFEVSSGGFDVDL